MAFKDTHRSPSWLCGEVQHPVLRWSWHKVSRCLCVPVEAEKRKYAFNTLFHLTFICFFRVRVMMFFVSLWLFYEVSQSLGSWEEHALSCDKSRECWMLPWCTCEIYLTSIRHSRLTRCFYRTKQNEVNNRQLKNKILYYIFLIHSKSQPILQPKRCCWMLLYVMEPFSKNEYTVWLVILGKSSLEGNAINRLPQLQPASVMCSAGGRSGGILSFPHPPQRPLFITPLVCNLFFAHGGDSLFDILRRNSAPFQGATVDSEVSL